MHRVLAVVIALLLGGGVVAAVVKSDDNDKIPVVQSTTSPTQTFTFDGVAPTESSFTMTASPFEPSGTESPTVEPGATTDLLPTTATMDELPRTGQGSVLPAALLTIAIAIGAGIAVTRAARTSE
jgi:hypothetical protein